MATEGDGEVGGCARGIVAGKHVFSVLEGAASALAYVHILEAGLDARKNIKMSKVLFNPRNQIKAKKLI